MPNHGYPDNDASRTPSGKHDEGRKGPSDCDTRKWLQPVRIGGMAAGGDPANSRTDSNGDQLVGNGHYPVDGDANLSGRTTAAYPARDISATND